MNYQNRLFWKDKSLKNMTKTEWESLCCRCGICCLNRIYDRANLVLLNWSGMGLVENWKTPEIAGYIADYQIRDVDNDGEDEVVMAAVSKRALTGKASSVVLVYELF